MVAGLMIPPRLLLLVLSLCTLRASVVGAYERSLDWGICEADRKSDRLSSRPICFAPRTCSRFANPEINKIARITSKDMINPCYLGLHIRPYNHERELIMMEYTPMEKKGGDKDPNRNMTPWDEWWGIFRPAKSGDTLTLNYDGQILFGCKLDNNGKLKIVSDPKLKEEHKPEFYYNYSHARNGTMFCVISIINQAKLKKELENSDQKFASVKFFEQQTEKPVLDFEFTKQYSGLDPIMNQTTDLMYCDPAVLQHSDRRHHMRVQPLFDLTRSIIDCSNHGPLKHTLFAIVEDPEGKEKDDREILGITCVPANKEWQIIDLDNSTRSFDYGLARFQCALNVSKLCVNPLADCKGDNCPVFSPGTDASPALLNCEGGKWLVDGDYLTDREPNCKVDFQDPEKPVFYMNTRQVESGVCFKEYNCSLKSQLRYSECEEDSTCLKLHRNDERMRCENDVDVIVSVLSSNTTYRAKHFDCNTSSGHWMSQELDVVLPEKDGIVTCRREPAPVVIMSTFTIGLIIVGSILGIIMLFFLIGFIYYFCIAHRNLRQLKRYGKRKWKRMGAEARIEAAKFVFDKVLASTPQSDVQIIHGLKFIEILLRTESEEPEVWEMAHNFLVKLCGTLTLLDHSLHELYTKWLYVEGKRIVTKHGWISEKLISNADYRGYIRVVAIRLLGLSLNAMDDAKAMDLLRRGFSKLRFNGIRQYPHCGVLWSLMTQHRMRPMDNNAGDKSINDPKKFMEALMQIAEEKKTVLPPERVIPVIGSVSHQAYYAVGCTNRLSFHLHETSSVITKEAYHPYMIGSASTIRPDPSRVVFCVFKLEDCDAMDNNELRESETDPATWTAIMKYFMRVMTFYGKSLDAKKLQCRFYYKTNYYEQFQLQTRIAQRQFRDSLNRRKEEIRKWLKKRTQKQLKIDAKADPMKTVTKKSSGSDVPAAQSAMQSVAQSTAGGPASTARPTSRKTSQPNSSEPKSTSDQGTSVYQLVPL